MATYFLILQSHYNSTSTAPPTFQPHLQPHFQFHLQVHFHLQLPTVSCNVIVHMTRSTGYCDISGEGITIPVIIVRNTLSFVTGYEISPWLRPTTTVSS